MGCEGGARDCRLHPTLGPNEAQSGRVPKVTFENRQRLLEYKRDLEIELRRVNNSLEDGTEEKFKRNNLWLGLDKPGPRIVQRLPGAEYVKDTKSGPVS
jgi:hypothetical protein